MASGDDETHDDTSSGFFPDDLEQHDHERDLYAILHINKDVCHLIFQHYFKRHHPF